MDRKIRDSLDFEGTPIKIIYRGKALKDVGRAARRGESSLNRINNKMGSPQGMIYIYVTAGSYQHIHLIF